MNRKAHVSEHDGRRSDSFPVSSFTGWRRVRINLHGCFFRVESKAVTVDETGTSEVGIAVTAKAPPARKARGVTSSDNAESGKPESCSRQQARLESRFEPPRACPPKQAPVNSRAHVSVGSRHREMHWVSSALHHPARCTALPVPATNERRQP